MDIKNIVDTAKDLVEEHKDDLKARAPGLTEDLAELKDVAQRDGSVWDKATAAVEAPAAPAE